jgi:23S rRNA (cytidine2498-2'-O)-methyltransferase
LEARSAIYFATCRAGAQAALKAEVAALRPAWRPAFARPGFVSWKLPAEAGPETHLDAILAHSQGLALARGEIAGVVDLAGVALDRLAAASRPPRLHCRARTVNPNPDAPNPLDAVARELEAELRAAHGFAAGAAAAAGDLVLDVVATDAGAVVLGFHRHGPGHSPHPGGRPPLVLPGDAPSRAWIKFEEALAWHPRPMNPGERVVEIGSAPGGTARAVCDRGAEIWCVDPAAVVPMAGLRHLRKPAAAVARAELPEAFDWLLIDINDNPGATLRLARRFIPWSARRPSLVLTLKTADWKVVGEWPAIRRQLAGLGYPQPFARQLFHGRREVVVLA